MRVLPRRGRNLFATYAAFVIASGGTAYGLLLLTTGPDEWGFTNRAFWLLGAFVVVAELVPLRVPRGDREGELTLSTTYGFALLLLAGPVAAATALAAASVVADAAQRKPLWKSLFNAAHYLLAIAAAHVVIRFAGAWYSGGASDVVDILAVLGAGVVFALVNVLTMAVALSTAGGASGVGSAPLSVTQILRGDASFLAWSYTVLVSVGPVVALTARANLAAVPLFVVPTVAVYQSMSIYLDRKRHLLHDPMTGLPNRALFEDRVGQAIVHARRTQSNIAVLLFNIDQFKEVNSTLSYQTGDVILCDIAHRLRAELPEVDTVARLGADEFGIALTGVDEHEVVEAVVVRLRTAVARPFVVGAVNLALEASVGGVMCPENGTNPGDLISKAERAMAEAKRQRFGYQWYAPPRRGVPGGRMRLLADLRVALDGEDLELRYQPKAALPSGRISGVEALVRWRRHGGELVLPAQFIPVAEETGLMADITHYVLEEAIGQARRWRDAGTDLPVAVNISARDLHDEDLPDTIADMLARHGVPPTSLELEITESSIIADMGRAVATLWHLREMGVRLAIDDFGTGNTSMAQLTTLPVDVLKIDRSFVQRLDSGEDDVIVRTAVELGRGLGLSVVAEGVSSAVVWDQVIRLGCDYAQGYYLSRPVRAREIASMVGGPGSGSRSAP